MPDPAHLTAFAIAAVTIALIPGPAMLYVLARSLGGGRRAGLLSSVGTGIGGLAHVAAAAVGLSALIATSAVAFSVVKYAGAAYLVWLGIQALRGSDADLPAREPAAGALKQGILTEALNPKTALFSSDLPPFSSASPRTGRWRCRSSCSARSASRSTRWVDVVVALGAGRISERIRARPRMWRRQQRTTGGILVGLGVYAAAAGHRRRLARHQLDEAGRARRCPR